MRVKFYDLTRQNEVIRQEALHEISLLLDSGSLVLGAKLEEFEAEYSRFIGGASVIGVASGTDALEIAIRALELPRNSEVLVPSNSFVASAIAVVRAGLIPRFTGFDLSTGLVTAADFERNLGPNVSAVMPVHLFGQMAPMQEIIDLAEGHGLRVIEDASQAHGATQYGISAGAYGDISATSFYPTKNLGGWGDGGAVVTRSPELEEKARLLRNYGGIEKYEHLTFGFNSRLDPVQAIVLLKKLKYLEAWNEQRAKVWEVFDSSISATRTLNSLELLHGNLHVYHLSVVHSSDSRRLRSCLDKHGIQWSSHYPVLIPDTKMFCRHPQHSSPDFESERLWAASITSLPMFPLMTPKESEFIASAIASV